MELILPCITECKRASLYHLSLCRPSLAGSFEDQNQNDIPRNRLYKNEEDSTSKRLAMQQSTPEEKPLEW